MTWMKMNKKTHTFAGNVHHVTCAAWAPVQLRLHPSRTTSCQLSSLRRTTDPDRDIPSWRILVLFWTAVYTDRWLDRLYRLYAGHDEVTITGIHSACHGNCCIQHTPSRCLHREMRLVIGHGGTHAWLTLQVTRRSRWKAHIKWIRRVANKSQA